MSAVWLEARVAAGQSGWATRSPYAVAPARVRRSGSAGSGASQAVNTSAKVASWAASSSTPVGTGAPEPRASAASVTNTPGPSGGRRARSPATVRSASGASSRARVAPTDQVASAQ